MRLKTRHRLGVASLSALTLASAGGAAYALPAAARSAAGAITVVADNLNNPRQLSWGEGNSLLVAEAGSGGPNCDSNGNCIGFTGAVTQVKEGRQSRVVSGLLSDAANDGTFAVGSDGVAAKGDRIYVIMTSAGPNDSVVPAPGDAQVGNLLAFDKHGNMTNVADIDGYEFAHPNDPGNIDSNPYNVIVDGDTQVVVDAGANTLLQVKNGVITQLSWFPKPSYDPPSVQDTVPTSVAIGPDHAYYVGELGGGGTPTHGSRVWRVKPGETPTVFAGGFDTITGMAFGHDGSMYVCEFSTDPNNFDPHGDIVKVARDGTRTRLGLGSLFFPGGVAVDDHDNVFVSNWSVAPAQDGPFGPSAHGRVVEIASGR